MVEEYRAHHAGVWPEMRQALSRCGWHNYTLFLDDDGTLFGYFETPDSLEALSPRCSPSRSTSDGRS